MKFENSQSDCDGQIDDKTLIEKLKRVTEAKVEYYWPPKTIIFFVEIYVQINYNIIM